MVSERASRQKAIPLMVRGSIAAIALVALAVSRLSLAANLAEPPREYVDSNFILPSGRTIAVPAGGNFQAALHQARPGDVITLEAGAVFRGPFTLPKKSSAGWILIRTSAPDSDLPAAGIRVTPAHAQAMPKLEAATGPVIRTDPGAHHYRFVGIEIRPSEGNFLYNLVQLGYRERSLDDLPHHIILDRCYLHGDPKKGSRRGIAMNSRYTAVIDSHLSDFKEVGADSQAIAGWNGPGPFQIMNNYLEAAGENVMFGGADPAIPDLVPSDIEIRRNHFSKPLAWRIGDPVYRGVPWTVKNLFELKNARRVLIEGNLFEHNWVHAQSGLAILFTVRNQDGSAPWSVVEDVTFIHNIVRHAASGIYILGRDDNHPSRQTKRVLIKNNLFDDVGGVRWGGGGRLFQMIQETEDVVVDHNTAFQSGNIITAEGRHDRFRYTNNISLHNEYGMIGSGTGVGNPTLTTYFPDAIVRKNVIIGGNAGQYPGDNFFPASLDAVRFLGGGGSRYCLAGSSRYKSAATDGKDVGVDFDALSAALGKPQLGIHCRPASGRGT